MSVIKVLKMTPIRSFIVYLTLLLGILMCSAEEDHSIQQHSVEESLDNVLNLVDEVVNLQTDEHANNKTEVIKTCQAFLKEYAFQSSTFTKCLIENARPFRFCETCVKYYKKASTVFTDMTGYKECSEMLLRADRVQVVRLVNINMESIWKNAYCNDCFESIDEDPTNGTVHFTLTNNTDYFLELFKNMTQCLNYTIQLLDTTSNNQTRNISYCEKCRTHYKSLNEHFTTMLEDSSSQVCMDVVDMMNYTRLMWSKKLKCSNRKGDVAPVLAITGVICALPVIFYITNRVIRPRTEKTIVIQRRMKFPQTNSYGSLSGSGQSFVNSNSQTVESVSSLQTPR